MKKHLKKIYISESCWFNINVHINVVLEEFVLYTLFGIC